MLTIASKLFTLIVPIMKTLPRSFHFISTTGFTMIELLVVIAVIGVLAVAVLSSINPIEQINKGRDTRSRSDAAQIINAVDRYFSIHEEYPWNKASGDYVPPSGMLYDDEFIFDRGTPTAYNQQGTTTTTTDWDWALPLTETNEVKSGFTSRLADDTGAGKTKYFIFKRGIANATMYVCFRPSSKAFEEEAKKSCEQQGDNNDPDFPLASACPGVCTDTNEEAPTDNSCMVCLP